MLACSKFGIWTYHLNDLLLCFQKIRKSLNLDHQNASYRDDSSTVFLFFLCRCAVWVCGALWPLLPCAGGRDVAGRRENGLHKSSNKEASLGKKNPQVPWPVDPLSGLEAVSDHTHLLCWGPQHASENGQIHTRASTLRGNLLWWACTCVSYCTSKSGDAITDLLSGPLSANM